MAWALVNSWTFSSGVPNVDFTGLAGHTDVCVLIRGVTLSVSGIRSLQVSIDNGSTFLNTTSDYFTIAGTTGAESTATMINGHSTASGLARSCGIEICGFNLTAPKIGQMMNRSDPRTVIMPSGSALNAVRVLGSAGGNLTAGNIYVYAR